MAKDPTIAARMRRYRARRKAAGFRRQELSLPAAEAAGLASTLKLRRLVDGDAALDRALTTINVPRPHLISRAEFLQALIAPQPQWRPHVEAFFGEVDPGTIHEICLAGLLNFPLLAAVLRIWNLEDAPHAEWIRDMARERLAKAARRHPADRSAPS